MVTPSPPKPWERAKGSAGVPSSSIPSFSSQPPSSTIATSIPNIPSSSTSMRIPTSGSDPPPLPDKPSALSSVVNRTASNYAPLASNRLGSSSYGGMASYGSYSSPYSRLSGYGGGMYGGMGGMGGMGGYGSMYGGMGGYGMGGFGAPGDPNDPNSLTNSLSQSTQATFQIIESIVGAFGGFAQMLESTYMATHSSFFAMVSVAEQFGNLRDTLGSILGIFTLLRWVRTLLAKLTGRAPPADAMALTPSAFARFQGRSGPADASSAPGGRPRPSKKPFLVFMLAVFGLPYLMGKVIRALARSQEEEEKRRRGLEPGMAGNAHALDPSKLDFCKVLYDFAPESSSSSGVSVSGVDLAVSKGDLVAVLSRSDPMGQPSEWWRCRARDGRVGYLPSPYLETIQRRSETKAITTASQAGSRAGSLTSQRTGSGGGVASTQHVTSSSPQSHSIPPPPPPPPTRKVGDISAESFYKSQFYS